ncbi:ring hydroxylating alpha subunit family protein [Mycobacterium xenopi 3993]|nr:ring hydroxylating alpha subunit family protein [Mycobacterium xenopi 3993]
MKHLHHANWKMVVENNVDGYHALFTHASVYDAIRPAKVSHVPSKVDVVVRDMGNGHSEIDYSNEYRKLNEEFVWYGRIPREKLAEYVEALERTYGPSQAHDALVVGPPHTLIWPNLFLAEMNVMFVEPQAVNRTIAYTTAVLMPGQDKLNERTLRRSEGAMGPAGFLIADDGEIGMRNQAGWPPNYRSGWCSRAAWTPTSRTRPGSSTQTRAPKRRNAVSMPNGQRSSAERCDR